MQLPCNIRVRNETEKVSKCTYERVIFLFPVEDTFTLISSAIRGSPHNMLNTNKQTKNGTHGLVYGKILCGNRR